MTAKYVIASASRLYRLVDKKPGKLPIDYARELHWSVGKVHATIEYLRDVEKLVEWNGLDKPVRPLSSGEIKIDL